MHTLGNHQRQFVQSILSYRVPGFILFFFKRSQVNIQLNLIFTFEILWRLPQVPFVGAASAVLEAAGLKNVSCFIHNFKFCSGDGLIVFCYEVLVLLARPAYNGVTYR